MNFIILIINNFYFNQVFYFFYKKKEKYVIFRSFKINFELKIWWFLLKKNNLITKKHELNFVLDVIPGHPPGII